ncbi:uncharacterized protein BP01DRAFT_359462 [Aspergillus saccharolyticus JOP 1030-1]|uniref:Uncharacterized protein n=1 Tax=Aspergillus saccharolyticus JOP 1030-1 TaxID=1450539 RepID=A0A319A4K7_9EURO|nr:hypothetical protein BP01DRAFT_359462 [Aspergillus saccharolyticus JOP 1030-1]PYH42372.1 hypothetical protein BP01DRAFT_359462 [Aspergillus saccharolyticus JOP 1030-1]
MSQKLDLTLTTTLTLLDQFQTAITSASASLPPASTSTSNSTTTETTIPTKDALPLLSASALTLKSQITKLSLVTITAPFTATAATPILTALNDSVLPSLVTAALLITPTDHTQAFQTEAHALTRLALTELGVLLGAVQGIATSASSNQPEAKSEKQSTRKGGAELAQSRKEEVTLAAARAWEACDAVIDLAAKGVVGFVVRRVEQWRDLVRDAVGEIEEWDPEEEGDEFFDELLSDDEKQGADDDDDDDNKEEGGDDDDEEETAALHAQKKITLKMLKPIAQVYPAIVTHRLKKTPDTVVEMAKLETLMKNLQMIPELVDEIAGALYEADPQKSGRFLTQAKERAVLALQLVTLPWQGTGQDKFTTWANTWLKVMEELSKSIFVSA